jgi:hypothetical protein
MVDKDEKFYIGTTRFTTATFAENTEWRKKHNWEGCIYGLNKKNPTTIPYMALVYVIEMNNDTNKIEGIGLIRNYINQDYKTCVYKSDRNYNRYIYNSIYRKNVTDIKYIKIIEMLELLLFKGSGHYKRGQGITTISWERFDDLGKKVIKSFFHKLFD